MSRQILGITPHCFRALLFFFFFWFFFKIYLYLFLAVLGLRFCARAFSSCGNGGHSSSRCAGLSLSWPLLLRSTGSRRAGSVIVGHGPSYSAACGIFPDQGSNPCPLHWQADSQPLRHQGSPRAIVLRIYYGATEKKGRNISLRGFIQNCCKLYTNQYKVSVFFLFFLVLENYTPNEVT